MKNVLGKLVPRKMSEKGDRDKEAGELAWRKLMTKDILTKK